MKFVFWEHMILFSSNSLCYKYQYLFVAILSRKHKGSAQRWWWGHNEALVHAVSGPLFYKRNVHLGMVLNVLHKTLPSLLQWHFMVTHNQCQYSMSPVVLQAEIWKFNSIYEGCEVKDNFNYLWTLRSYAYNAVLNDSSSKIFKFLMQAELTTWVTTRLCFCSTMLQPVLSDEYNLQMHSQTYIPLL
jgi:hypothetical protein